MRKIIAVLLIVAGVLLGFYVYYKESSYNTIRPFSPYSLLNSSWEEYKKRFINQDGRVLDFTLGDVTTSEGQSYALLRAVYIDDKETFDKVWDWTNGTLKRSDNLFSWKWGKRSDETYGLLAEGGENSATDADTEIALALIFASKRWNDDKYNLEAKKIIEAIWDTETAEVKGKRYLIGGNWANLEDKIVINPSYFAPYAWRIFDEIDSDRDWKSLIEPSYEVLEIASNDNLDKDTSVGLPPNWFSLDKTSGEVQAVEIEGLTSDYSFDAMRIPFRVALDYLWFNENRAKDYLINNFKFLSDEFGSNKKLLIGYSHDGKGTNTIENPAMYATSLGYFIIYDKAKADEIYQTKIIDLYSNEKNTFNDEIPYYEQNWLWFGVLLYNQSYVNLLK